MKLTIKASALFLVFTIQAALFAMTYTITPYDLNEGYRIDGGFITTNGTLGVLTDADIVDFENPGHRSFAVDVY